MKEKLYQVQDTQEYIQGEKVRRQQIYNDGVFNSHVNFVDIGLFVLADRFDNSSASRLAAFLV